MSCETNISDFNVRSASQITGFQDLAMNFLHLGWAEFILREPVAVKMWESYFDLFLDYAFLIIHRSGTPAAVGLTVPLTLKLPVHELPDEGWQWMVGQVLRNASRKEIPNILCAVAAVVHPDFRGNGLASRIVMEMKSLAAKNALAGVIAPLRLPLKSRYPHMSMQEYITWKCPDGKPYDPWLRVHLALGAKQLGICSRSIIITADLPKWTAWTGQTFSASGEYFIPGGDAPLMVNLTENTGTYTAAGVWVMHVS